MDVKDLSKLNINNSDDIELDHFEEEDLYSSNDAEDKYAEDAPDNIPDSMLKYFVASKNRASLFEKLILEDVKGDDYDELGTAEVFSFNVSNFKDVLLDSASGSNLHEDPAKFKGLVMSEMENEELNAIPKEASLHNVSDHDIPDSSAHTNQGDAYLESEKQLSLELKALECKLKEEEEKRIQEYEMEREEEQIKQRKMDEWRKSRNRDFEEDLRKIAEVRLHYPAGVDEATETETEENLQQELLQHQELISCLQAQLQDERRAFENAQEEEHMKRQQARCRAAITVQAALRGHLVRRWTRPELHRRRDEQRRCQEERRMMREREERARREQEELRQKLEEEECRRKLEDEEMRSRAEYEKAKEEEREEKRNNDEQISEEKQVAEKEFSQRRRKDKEEIELDEKKPENLQTLAAGRGRDKCQTSREEKPAVTQRSSSDPSDLSDPIDPEPAVGPVSVSHGPVSVSLPPHIEQRGLAWRRGCPPWSELSLQNQRKQLKHGGRTPGRRGGRRAAEGSRLPPLCTEILLQSGAWNSLQEITTVALERLPACSLTTLSQCPRLQSLTMTSCGLTSLEGLSRCTELRYIDVQDNVITFVNCENLENLRILRLGRNRLTSIHGLADAVNLDILEISHNAITRISGLESLKRLQKLLLDHNQLISTRGLGDVCTLLTLGLSHNHLSSVAGLQNCPLLRTLDLAGNNLTEPPSLHNQVLLRELSLDDNSMSSLRGLTDCWLPLIQLLSVAQNSITQLPSLSDFVSLEKLDARQNCLSELQNLCDSLQGCPVLREVHLTGNPVLQEPSWRSSLQKAVPGLQDIDGQPPAPPTGQVRALLHVPQHSFLTFCQDQLLQLQNLHHRHNLQLRGAVCPLESLRLTLQHHEEHLRLAEEHRCAHERGHTQPDRSECSMPMASVTPAEQANVAGMESGDGVVSVTEMVQPERKFCEGSSSHLQVLPLRSRANGNTGAPPQDSAPKCSPVTGFTGVDGKPDANTLNKASFTTATFPQEPRRPQVKTIPQSKTIPQVKTIPQSKTIPQVKTIPQSKTIPQVKTIPQSKTILQVKTIPQSKLDLKNTAATVIQRHWRGRQRIQPGEGRGEGSHAGSKQGWLEPGYAATTIQAVWRGYALRRRLAAALAQARAFHSGDQVDDFEEVDVDEFVFDETVLETAWMMTPLSDNTHPRTVPHTPPFPEQLRGPEHPRHVPEPRQQTSPPVPLWKPKQAWTGGDRAEPSLKTVSPESISSTKSPASASGLSGLSERSEKILEEWGFTDSNTALLMLKRAQKMKSKKQQQRKLLDPSVRLALFRHHSNQHAPQDSRMKPAAEPRQYITAHQTELALEGTSRVDQGKPRKGDQTRLKHERTYQWLHTQPLHSHSRHSESQYFLPEIDPDILNGGRVQLVAAAYRESPDQISGSPANSTSNTPPRKGHVESRRHSTGQPNRIRTRSLHQDENDIPLSPQRVSSAPTKKERMSFRDNPVLKSGGWGGGKKRDKLHK
ncbi:hypothetical protein UPYG_G00269400 [Umbra pygmaea]|uniref:Leucine-rich repeat and IQ domain-containing protein 1 n=1 Tax=Umbra pygmaea TaxID=75934 RepID=A0ABD0WF97_UMBPY